MATITPGEWYVAGLQDDGSWEVRSEDGTLIARVYTGQADAKAITAVPDMKRALQGVIGGRHNLVGVGVRESIHQLAAVKKCCAAMDKANGE